MEGQLQDLGVVVLVVIIYALHVKHMNVAIVQMRMMDYVLDVFHTNNVIVLVMDHKVLKVLKVLKDHKGLKDL